jgi:hypothetical protein
MGHSFWPGRIARRWLIDDGRRRVKRWPVRSRAARSAAERWERKSTVGGGFLGDDQSRDKWGQPMWGGDNRRPPMPSTHRAWDQATVPSSQYGNGPLTCGPGLVKYIFKFPNSTQICKFIKETFAWTKNIKTFHATRFEYFQQLFQLGRLQILNKIHVINSGTEFNLNLP